jgi:hypothetical protein
VWNAGPGIPLEIAAPSLPLVLFDSPRYAVVMGRLAPSSLKVQAIAPSLGAILLETGGGTVMLGVLFAAALLNPFLTWRYGR